MLTNDVETMLIQPVLGCGKKFNLNCIYERLKDLKASQIPEQWTKLGQSEQCQGTRPFEDTNGLNNTCVAF